METKIMTVSKIEQLTYDTILLSLKTSEKISFIPGQFMVFTIEREDFKKPKSYSIFSQKPGELIFLIKMVEGGFAGEKFKKTKVGDQFELKGPLGHFVFDEKDSNEEIWFIGCGCGLSPLYCMLKEHLSKNPDKKFNLLISYKKKEDLLFDQELKELEQKNANFQYLPTLTRDSWEGRTGRVNQHLPKGLENKTFYICGIKELVVDTKELLLSKGVDSQKVKFERYD